MSGVDAGAASGSAGADGRGCGCSKRWLSACHCVLSGTVPDRRGMMVVQLLIGDDSKRSKIEGPDNPTCQLLPTGYKREAKSKKRLGRYEMVIELGNVCLCVCV